MGEIARSVEAQWRNDPSNAPISDIVAWDQDSAPEEPHYVDGYDHIMGKVWEARAAGDDAAADALLEKHGIQHGDQFALDKRTCD